MNEFSFKKFWKIGIKLYLMEPNIDPIVHSPKKYDAEEFMNKNFVGLELYQDVKCIKVLRRHSFK